MIRKPSCGACLLSVVAAMWLASDARAQNLFASTGSAGNILAFTPAGTQSGYASGLTQAGALAFDSAGNLFVTGGNGTITEITPGGIQSQFASGLSGPGALAFNAAGNLFVGETTSATILMITPLGAKSVFTS